MFTPARETSSFVNNFNSILDTHGVDSFLDQYAGFAKGVDLVSNDFLGTNSVGGVRNVELQLKCLRFASFLYSEHIDVDSIRQQNQYYLDVVSDYLNTGKLDSHSSAVVVSFFRQCVASASDPLLQLNSDDLDLIQQRLDFLLKDDVEEADLPIKLVDVPTHCAAEVLENSLILVRPDLMVTWRGNSVPDNPQEIIDRVRGA